MRHHTETVHGEEFFCPIESCNEKFNSRYALAQHKKRHKKATNVINAIQVSLKKNTYLDIKKNFMKVLKFQIISVWSMNFN